MAKNTCASILTTSIMLVACNQPVMTLPPASPQATGAAVSAELPAVTQTATVESSATAYLTQEPTRAPMAPPTGLIAFQAFSKQDGIFIVQADGSEARQVISGAAVFSGPIAWAPDGQVFYYLADQGSGHGMLEVYRGDPEGLDPYRLTHDEFTDSDIALSPDGTQMAYVSSRPVDSGRYEKQLMLMPAGGGPTQRVIDAQVDVGSLAWSTSGTALAFTATIDGHADCPSLFVVRLPNELAEIGGGRCHYGTPQWQPDADGILTICQMPDPNGEIGICLSGGPSGAQSLVIDGGIDAAVWSPDGASIAFIRQVDDITRSLCIAKADGTNQKIVVPEYPVTFVGSDLVWSPDGVYIAYTAQVDGENMGVYVVSVNEGETARLPVEVFGPIGKLSWHS